MDQRLKEKYKDQNQEEENIDFQFCYDYNEVKRDLQNHQHQLEAFLEEYKKMEVQEIRKINKIKKGKEKNAEMKRKKRESVTLIFKSLRPIQEKKDRMQKIVDILSDPNDLQFSEIAKS